MHAIIERLQSGRRWWAAEIVARLIALVFLLLSAGCTRALRTSVESQPGPLTSPSSGTPWQFFVAAAAFVALVGGLALLIEGPGLFRLVPYPRRRLF